MMKDKTDLTKRHWIYCEFCSYKQIFEEIPEDLVKIPVVDIPGGIPQYDAELKRTITKKQIKNLPKSKCPKCGRGVRIRPLPEVYSKQYQTLDEQRRKEQEEHDKQQRLIDGVPHTKKAEDE